MKTVSKKNLKELLATVCLMSGTSLMALSQWQTVGPNGGMVNSSSDYSSIAVDTNNVTYVAYSSLANSSKLHVKKFDGTDWIDVGNVISTGSAIYCNVAVSRNNIPYVVYRDGTAGNSKLTVKQFDGTDWVLVGTQNFTPGNSAKPSIAFAPDNTPYVAFTDFAGSANGKATVMKFDGTSWSIVGTYVSSGSSSYPEVRIASDGTPYCAFIDAGLGGLPVVKKFENNAWVAIATSVSASVSKNLSFQLNAMDQPVVSFTDVVNSNRLTVRTFDGTNWNAIGTAGFSPSAVGGTGAVYSFSSLVIDKTGRPIVAYADADSNDRVTVMRYSGAGWDVLGTQPAAEHRAKCVGLTVDKANTVYGSYTFSPTGNTGPWPNYVIKYDLCESMDSISATATAICFGDTVTLTVNGVLGNATDWEWTTGTCDGNVIGTGTSLQVMPTTNTTYYVKAANGCLLNTCESISVDVTHLDPVVQHQPNNGTYILSTTGTFATYQWYRNGIAIAGATNATYETNVLAIYSVEVTGGDCTVMSADYNLAENVSVRSAEEFQRQLKVFPNPATDHLNIEVPENVTIQFISVHGKIVKEGALTTGSNNIDISALPSSVYMVHFVDRNGQRITSHKFTKE